MIDISWNFNKKAGVPQGHRETILDLTYLDV
jgi:hypothetical protein